MKEYQEKPEGWVEDPAKAEAMANVENDGRNTIAIDVENEGARFDKVRGFSDEQLEEEIQRVGSKKLSSFQEVNLKMESYLEYLGQEKSRRKSLN